MKGHLLFLLLTPLCLSQPALEGAYGFSFGMSKRAVQERADFNEWERHPCYRDDLLNCTSTKGEGFSLIEFWFEEGKLSLIRTRSSISDYAWIPEGDTLYILDDDRFHLGRMRPVARRNTDEMVMAGYRKLVDTLIQQFGNPMLSQREFRNAVARGDVRDIDAVKRGRGAISDEWRIPTADRTAYGAIRSEITVRGEIEVMYQRRAPRSATERMKKIAPLE